MKSMHETKGNERKVRKKHKHIKGTRQTSIVLATATVPTCAKTKVWAKTGHRHCEKHRFLLCCRATRTTVCQPVLIITAVLHNVTVWWINRFGLPNGTRLLNPLNAKLNPTCHLLALLGAHRILHISRKRVKLITFGGGGLLPGMLCSYNPRRMPSCSRAS